LRNILLDEMVFGQACGTYYWMKWFSDRLA
jgi:hypothetical protein